mmetsp:Transcript_23421/g.34574  ORF Transcript_23421/g.34574 Transcript_23421/m.34574 type:complete len:504 (+) Transcript_23421:182-1693(+)|eukprot:CAMPEP_0194254722 /NCGR_PEP_ID=MMETSP0158-20130606/32750_1 /TAXON_ID=33649 /ORGANISM="Thalassionema nitzschioides, Strain L26-B" /LENGTH=503 /DNA_ID=CAMNT_0038992853 /DNA_START=109 /DNA_END=1623 /DNA_ORIENTATION=+
MSSSSLVCALSGNPIRSIEEAVVTPSGRICLKSLLLSKLADNGGSDPFSKQPLEEDQLISLSPGISAVIPPRPSAASMPALLELLNTEYSNLVLELFDTRQLLEETRKELSQALYQNDAAVRVVARLSQERDAARQELASWKAGEISAAPDSNGSSRKRTRTEEEEESSAPQTVQANAIPESHLDLMTQTWQTLSKQRKAKKKEIAAQAPSMDDLKSYEELNHKSYHNAKGKQGIVDMIMSGEDNMIVSAGKDRQIIFFDGNQVVESYGTGRLEPRSIDAIGKDLVAVASKSKVMLFFSKTEKMELELQFSGAKEDVVGVSLHPSKQHVVVATTNRIHIYSTKGDLLTYFDCPDKITCGALHPDGLIYAVGTGEGKLAFWDFKSQKLASTLGDGGKAILRIVFSNNGYHVASLSDVLNVWDLKKQAKLIELVHDKGGIDAAIFDSSGKYLAYGGADGITICAVKGWTKLVELEYATSHLIWGKSVVSSSTKQRAVRFYGSKLE